MTSTQNDKLTTFLKYFNSALITVITLILLYGVNSINQLHDSVDELKLKIEVEATQRQNNSGIILDHEGRIRSLEDNMKTHEAEIKEWTNDNFIKK